MKKLIICLFILVISSTDSLNNPIAVPQAIISELLFKENNTWILEIGFGFNVPYHYADFDSICMSTSDGNSKIKINSLKENDSLFVINADSLISHLTINRNGDFIKLYSYLSSKYPREVLIDSLVFGNYPNSSFDSLKIGYSICRLDYFIFSKDKSPTIGLPNDTCGTCGTLTGFIYDKDSDLITQGNFQLEYPILFAIDGTYSTRVFSRKTAKTFLDTITNTNQYRGVPIESLYINIEPDSTLGKDIHLLVDYAGVITEHSLKRNYELTVINYPNPFNSVTNFAIALPQSLRYQQGMIKIFNIHGQEIKNIVLSSNLNSKWDGTDKNGFLQPSGIYYYQLIFDNIAYKKGSMIFLK